MYREKNYVMAGAKYGIGAMLPEHQAKLVEGQIVAQEDAEKKRLMFAAVGAGIGWFVAKTMIGALIGAGIGFYLTNILKEAEVVKDAVAEDHKNAQEPPPETPSSGPGSPEREESF